MSSLRENDPAESAIVTFGPGTSSTFEVDIVGPPPGFDLTFAVRLDRLGKRRCRGCGHRRIVFALRGYAGSVVISSSRLLCSRCAGLIG